MIQKNENFDFNGRLIRDEPWTYYTRLREQGPLIRIKLPFFGKVWAVTNYEHVSEVLKDTDRFVRDSKNAGRKTIGRIQWLFPQVFKSLINNMLGADGEKHRRLRSIVDQAFALRSIEQMSPRIAMLAKEQVQLAAENAQQDSQFDLVKNFARPFPLTVICELLGLPLEDRAKFREWFAPLSDTNSIFGLFRLTGGIKKVAKYLNKQFQVVRTNPREGLMTDLVQLGHRQEFLTENGDQAAPLSDDELLAMVFLLLVAGHETTVHLITNAVHVLLRHPEVKSELLADWSKSDQVIEEVLRFCSPIQVAKPRFVANDMEFLGQQLKRGQLIMPMIACANYDPARFENPTQFDINRERNYHMSFGSGPHVCLGIKLARSETQIALMALFERWPNLRADYDLSHPNWSRRLGTRGFKSMLVKV